MLETMATRLLVFGPFLAAALLQSDMVGAQYSPSGTSRGVPGYLAFFPLNPIGDEIKAALVRGLSASKVLSMLPDDPSSNGRALFDIDIDSVAIGGDAAGCRKLGVGDADEKTSATAVSFIYQMRCQPNGPAHVAGRGLAVCTRKDVQACAERILTAAEGNASVIAASCSRGW